MGRALADPDHRFWQHPCIKEAGHCFRGRSSQRASLKPSRRPFRRQRLFLRTGDERGVMRVNKGALGFHPCPLNGAASACGSRPQACGSVSPPVSGRRRRLIRGTGQPHARRLSPAQRVTKLRGWVGATRTFEIKGETSSGQVTVDDKHYDLANGSVFLVSGLGGKLRVKQLSRDLSTLRNDLTRPSFDSAALIAFGKNDPDIKTFFSQTANRE